MPRSLKIPTYEETYVLRRVVVVTLARIDGAMLADLEGARYRRSGWHRQSLSVN
jgi:hypothetical protein